MKLIVSAFYSTFLLSSCFSYKIFPKEYRSFTYAGEKKNAFIINPELKKEFEILKRSGVFNIVSDSSSESVVKIKLYPLQKNFACGEPIIASWITLGQMPVYLPDRYQYRFDEVEPAITVQRHYELKLAMRYWFWDMFAFKKNFKKKAGQTLLAEYYNN